MDQHSDKAIPQAQRRGVKGFAVAIAAGQCCALIRYIVLARILGPAELGLAVMIVLTAQFFDSITDSGSDRFLIQDSEGGQPRAQRLVQLVAAGRGVTIALALILFAGPIAAFYETPGLEFGLRVLAIAPLLSGMIHLDLRRTQRDHDFRIEGRATLVAEIVSLMVTAAAAFATHSYIAIVFGLIARAAMLVLVSHIMSQRRFTIGISREFATRLALFGGPLMINGLVLFLGSQSDRLLISKFIGLAELGRYSAVMLLIFYPIMVVQRFIAGLYLPQVVRAAPKRIAAADELGGVALIIAIAATFGFALVAPIATQLFFGPKFAQGFLIIGLIGILNAARFLKLWPINILLGGGRSGMVLANNLVRLIAIPVAIWCALHLRSLESIVAAFILGEIIALAVGIVLANHVLGRRLTTQTGRLALFCAASVVVVIGTESARFASVMGLLVATALGLAVLLVLGRGERSALNRLLHLLPLHRIPGLKRIVR